jgi:Ni,Fe-hydrogenase III large subunit/Ni,Fe-hydrogenase III component G
MNDLAPQAQQTGAASAMQEAPSSASRSPWRPAQPGVRLARVDVGDLGQVVDGLAASGESRLADLFGALEDGELVLRAVYGRDREGGYAVLEWPVDGEEYPPLSDVTPAAFLEECEIYEQFGVRPQGGKTLNRVVVPPHAERGFPRLGSAPKNEASEVHAPHFVAGEAIEFPFGPVRAVGQESLYIGLVTSGEEVIDVYLLQWHKHRGIERRLQGLDPTRGLFFVERAEGLSAVGNSWAFCQAVESITGATVPEDVLCTRAVALELERLYNHAAALAAIAQATGLSVGQAQAEIALEQFLRLNVAAAGHRYLFGLLAIGGVNRPLDTAVISEQLPVARGELRRVADALMTTNSFLDRLEACGIVTSEAAARLGLVGPVARDSGQDLDCRRDHPVGPYGGRPAHVPVRQAGDVLSRVQVMLEEVEESARLVSELAGSGLGAGVAEPASRRGPGRALGWCESPRGEALAWVALDESGRITRARLRPASVRNWRAFDDAARSRNVFTDIPIIEASFWLTVAGLAR